MHGEINKDFGVQGQCSKLRFKCVHPPGAGGKKCLHPEFTISAHTLPYKLNKRGKVHTPDAHLLNCAPGVKIMHAGCRVQP